MTFNEFKKGVHKKTDETELYKLYTEIRLSMLETIAQRYLEMTDEQWEAMENRIFFRTMERLNEK